ADILPATAGSGHEIGHRIPRDDGPGKADDAGSERMRLVHALLDRKTGETPGEIGGIEAVAGAGRIARCFVSGESERPVSRVNRAAPRLDPDLGHVEPHELADPVF